MAENVKKSITELVGNTPMVELTNYERIHNLKARLIGKLEYLNPTGSVKDRAALAMIEQAEREGKLKPGGTIVENTSGNTGISLAAFAAARGYKTEIFMDLGCSEERVQILKAYGATVKFETDIPHYDEISENGFDEDRMVQALTEYAEERGYYYSSQLHNAVNPEAHIKSTGPEIVRDMEGKIDFAVMLAGTAGTLTGVGSYLQQHVPGVKIIGVQPNEASMYKVGEERCTVDGVAHFDHDGKTTHPFFKMYDFHYDECIDVDGKEVYETARELALTDGLFLGASAAAAVLAARQIAERKENEGKNIVIILPDNGMKYLSTKIYRQEESDRNVGYII